VEQRSDTNIKPVAAVGAGVDPAYVPGLVNLRAPEAEDTEAESTEAEGGPSASAGSGTADPAAASGTGDAAEPSGGETGDPVEAGTSGSASDAGSAGAEAGDPAEASGEDAAESDADADGPRLEASDRRAAITAGRSGVRFTLDDQEADFRWDEIGAVEVAVPRFGKRLGVIVHTHTGRSYEADTEAPSRTVLKEWNEQLDAVLDAYFEEGDDNAVTETDTGTTEGATTED
jgi:hypothetical protein